MTTHDASADANGFVRFFRNYTKTWIHAVATAGLTAFGTLTIVHRWFAALAIASYLVPPIVLYLRRGRARPSEDSASVADSSEKHGSASGVERENGSGVESGQSGEPERAGARAAAKESATTNESTANTPDAAANTSSSETAGAESSAAAKGRSTAGPDGDGAGEAALEHADSEESDRSDDGRVDDDRPDDTVDGGEPTKTDDTRDRSTTDEATNESTETHLEWRAVDVPTDATLRDATVSSSGGYAVGDGGTVLADSGSGENGGGGESDDTSGNEENGDGNGWRILLEDGPAAGDNDLRGVDATTDGSAVWVAGDSGSLGRIDAETGRHVDYTAPEDITDNWLGVAVAGGAGSETVLLINGSGAVLRGRFHGDALEWAGLEKPGSGSSLSGVALLADGVGYCCDTNDGVYETTDGGESFERVGLEGADGTLTDVATTGAGECLVAADDGVVHRYDGPTWTPERVADRALSGIASSGDRVAVCTDDAVSERTEPTGDWERFAVDASGPLLGVATDGARGVAVGENGTLVERH
ncbi:hypothetical protein [Natronorubrum sp. DTA7]|uniref:hypothetical protein n=1 Tax=Natronorubrum sp. DTA7 TaxID=3447016 RepID=UPI003F84D280